MSPSVASSSSQASSARPFYIIIEGLPKEYTWQDLKDLVRQEASHGIWADMSFSPDGSTSGVGAAKLQRKEEAFNLYDFLTSNTVERRPLRVHLFDTNDPTTPRLLKANCSSFQGTPCPRCGQAQSRYANSARHNQSPLAQYARGVPAPGPITSAPASSMAALRAAQGNSKMQDPQAYALYQQQYQQALRAAHQQLQQQQVGGAAAYALSSTGMPVNKRNGIVQTEARGVFVGGLNFKARTKDVEDFFKRAGQLVKCELQKDRATSKFNGKAMIQYTAAAEAQNAVDMFSGCDFMGMKLKVRLDRDTTPVSSDPAQAGRPMQPLIVNGSQMC